MAEQTVEELTTQLSTLRTARVELLTSGGIKEVWRDGRKIVYDRATLKDLEAAIADTEARLAAASATNPAGRFRALRPRFS